MKKFIVYILLVSIAIIGIFCFVQKAVSQETELPKFSARVKISTDGDPIKNEMESYVNRELRSLGDVVIVDSNPDFHLLISAVEDEVEITSSGSRERRKIGFALFAFAVRPFDSSRMIDSLTSSLKFAKKSLKEIEDTKKIVELFTAGYVRLVFHWITSDSPSTLRRNCEELVVDFDRQVLEPDRRSWQEALDLWEELRKERIK